jgi:hypothetical protein
MKNSLLFYLGILSTLNTYGKSIRAFCTLDKHTQLPDSPMLDELESGPWPTFVAGIKRLAETKPMTADLPGRLEAQRRQETVA